MKDPEKINSKKENQKKPRKKKEVEEVKPWGRKERLLVFAILCITAGTSAILAFTNQNPNLNFSLFQKPNFKNYLSNSLSLDKPVAMKDNTISDNQVEDQKITDFRTRTQNLTGIYAFYLYDTTANTGLGLFDNQPFPLDGFVSLITKDTQSTREIQVKLERLGMVNTLIDSNTTTPQDIAKLGASFTKSGNFYASEDGSSAFLRVNGSRVLVIMSKNSLKNEVDTLFKEYANY